MAWTVRVESEHDAMCKTMSRGAVNGIKLSFRSWPRQSIKLLWSMEIPHFRSCFFTGTALTVLPTNASVRTVCVLFVNHIPLETSAWGASKQFCSCCTQRYLLILH